MEIRPRVLVLSGYDAASHQRWRHQLMGLLPDYEWQCLALPPRFFRWRIRGNPLTWLNESRLREQWDLIVATSMVDLATLRGLHPQLAHTPCLLYMHENQFAFPAASAQHASVEPQMVNLYSAIAADRVVFNSAWNRDSFLDGVIAFLKKMPDGVPGGLIETLRAKSGVIPVPIEDRLFIDSPQPINWRCPHILWNHRWEYESVGSPIRIVWAARWEYDKGPAHLLAALQELDRRGVNYRLCILGERFRQSPKEFNVIEMDFGHRLVQFGRAESRDEYIAWLRSADIVLSTALHEFQGMAVLEAVASGCIPILPNRLSYPELFESDYLYASSPEDPQLEAVGAVDMIESQALVITQGSAACPSVEHLSSSALMPAYRAVFEALMTSTRL